MIKNPGNGPSKRYHRNMKYGKCKSRRNREADRWLSRQLTRRATT